MHARVAHALEQGVGGLDGADGIHHQRHLGAPVARGDQGLGEAGAFRVVLKNVRFHVHVAAGLRDGLQHGPIRTGSVRQQPDPVAGRQRRTADGLFHRQMPRQEIVFGRVGIRRDAMTAAVTVARSVSGQAGLRLARLAFLRIGHAGATRRHHGRTDQQQRMRPTARAGQPYRLARRGFNPAQGRRRPHERRPV
ncbi:hypothetical protein D3C72_1509480 [compost metagenome]